jgi:ABC-type Fe3+ transport system substrate-binding protein
MDSWDHRITRRDALKAGAALGAGAFLGLRQARSSFASPPLPIPSASEWATIIAAAKKEGTVTYYSVNPDLTDALQTYFKRDYPWANLEVYAATPAAVQAKLLAEYGSGQYTADVVQTRDLVLPSYEAIGALTPSFLPNDANLPTALQDRTGYIHRIFQTPVCLSYNTNALKSPPPSDPYQLADPQWKNQLGIDDPVNFGPGWYFLASRRRLWGTKKWNTWMAGLKANNIKTFSTASNSYQAALQGQVNVVVDAYNDIQAQPAGTPMAAFWYSEPIAYYLGVSLVSKSPNPNAARVFMNWFLSPEGQRQISHSGRFSVNPPKGSLTISKVVPSGTTFMSPNLLKPYFAGASAVASIMCQTIQC